MIYRAQRRPLRKRNCHHKHASQLHTNRPKTAEASYHSISVTTATTQPRKRHTGQDLLCHCDDGVGYSKFTTTVAGNPDLSFEEICDRLSVGRRCTACLLNAEAAFTEASCGTNFAALPDGPAATTTAPSGRLPPIKRFKRKFYGAVDRVLPELPIRRIEVAPIFAGNNLRTKVCLSNSFSRTIGPKSARFAVRLRCLDASGKPYLEERFSLDVGARRVIDISKGMPKNDECPLTCGSCWIELKPKDQGCNGSSRPHFILEAARAVTALHTQAVNQREPSMVTGRDNPSERQFIAHVNTGNRPVDVMCSVVSLHTPASTLIEATLPTRCSHVAEIPVLNYEGQPVRGPYLLDFSATGTVRRHVLIADTDLGRISADHL